MAGCPVTWVEDMAGQRSKKGSRRSLPWMESTEEEVACVLVESAKGSLVAQ